MDLSQPARSLGPSLDLPVLSVLARAPRSWTTREVADAVGATAPGARQALERLASQGLVHVHELGRVRGYALNEEHVLAEAVRAAVDASPRLRRKIVDQVQGWSVPARAVVLFGSWARGDAGPGSDVDLLVLHDPLGGDDVEQWERQVDELRRCVRMWSGNGCDVLAFDPDDWAAHRARRDPIAASVLREGIVLHGSRALLTGGTVRRAVAS